MAMLTLVEAARKTGLTTLAKAIRSGRLSASRKEDGSYEIDSAELAQVYPFPAPGETVAATGPAVRRSPEMASLASGAMPRGVPRG